MLKYQDVGKAVLPPQMPCHKAHGNKGGHTHERARFAAEAKEAAEEAAAEAKGGGGGGGWERRGQEEEKGEEEREGPLTVLGVSRHATAVDSNVKQQKCRTSWLF